MWYLGIDNFIRHDTGVGELGIFIAERLEELPSEM